MFGATDYGKLDVAGKRMATIKSLVPGVELKNATRKTKLSLIDKIGLGNLYQQVTEKKCVNDAVLSEFEQLERLKKLWLWAHDKKNLDSGGQLSSTASNGGQNLTANQSLHESGQSQGKTSNTSEPLLRRNSTSDGMPQESWQTVTIAVTTILIVGLLLLVICLGIACYRRCIIPWVQSRFFKSDVNNDYGTYAESGDIVEAIDRNPHEPTTENRDQGRPLSDYDYDYMGDS